jgi:hypothetical protein
MRYIAALALALLLAQPVEAAECKWMSEDGGQILAEPGQITVIDDGGEEQCTLKGNGPGNPIMTAICGDRDWAFFTIKSEPGSDFDILIFKNTAWYEGC